MEYKRLTKRFTVEEINDFVSRAVVQLCPELSRQLLSMAVEYIAYKDGIEQGTLIELPCKVGDTVYCVDRNRSACYDCEHYSSFYGMDEICEKGCAIYPDIEKLKPICDKHFLEIDEIPFTLKWYGNYKDGFNKDWFTTREEAESRLRELQE